VIFTDRVYGPRSWIDGQAIRWARKRELRCSVGQRLNCSFLRVKCSHDGVYEDYEIFATNLWGARNFCDGAPRSPAWFFTCAHLCAPL